ncbi:MAG: hypothetical protein FWE28_00420 [Oscillospiraceae bacterium]|nr:hypothetical protein [Oscillospiraceae bacterium]
MAEWILIIITSVYTIATIAICFSNYRSAKAMRAQVAEMKRQYDEENRPRIAAELIYERKMVYSLRLINHGKRIATNVSVAFEQSFLDSLKEYEFRSALEGQKDRMCIIGIGQEYIFPIGSNELRKNPDQVTISGNITYFSGGEKYDESFMIDFGAYATFFSMDSDTDRYQKKMDAQTEELRKISAALTSMSSKANSVEVMNEDI